MSLHPKTCIAAGREVGGSWCKSRGLRATQTKTWREKHWQEVTWEVERELLGCAGWGSEQWWFCNITWWSWCNMESCMAPENGATQHFLWFSLKIDRSSQFTNFLATLISQLTGYFVQLWITAYLFKLWGSISRTVDLCLTIGCIQLCNREESAC